MVQVIQDCLELNITHQLLVYADDINKLVWSVHTVKENTEALLVASKECGLEVNAEKTKCMVMSRGSTQPREPREVNWGATWMKKVAAPGLENRD